LMKCTSCGEYIYKGRKFDPRKEITDEKYLSIQILRFYIRCTHCPAEITFKTGLKNVGYAYEKGAKRNFELRGDQSKMEEVNETTEKRLHRLMVEEAQEEEIELRERNAMAQLERRWWMDEIRIRNAQKGKRRAW
jgi:hypothetical protein